MRDPWFPVALILIVLLGVWLSIVGPLPNGVAAWLQQWQTLAAACVASVAAYIAFQNTSRTLAHSEQLEQRRRTRKHAALRAVLPLALAQVSDYAENSADTLKRLLRHCDGGAVPPGVTPKELIEPLPAETLTTLSDFIEYADLVDVSVLERIVARIQVHNSRLRGLYKDNHDPSTSRVYVRHELEGYIVDAAIIFAGAEAHFRYARQEVSELAIAVDWQDVRDGMGQMGFWEEEYPGLYEQVARRAKASTGPFERTGVSLLDRPADAV